MTKDKLSLLCLVAGINITLECHLAWYILFVIYVFIAFFRYPGKEKSYSTVSVDAGVMLRSESPCTRPVSWYPPVESFDRSSQFTAGVFMCGCKQTQMTKRKK